MSLKAREPDRNDYTVGVSGRYERRGGRQRHDGGWMRGITSLMRSMNEQFMASWTDLFILHYFCQPPNVQLSPKVDLSIGRQYMGTAPNGNMKKGFLDVL